MNANNEGMTAIGVPMESLARFLSSTTQMPVVDKTSLKGTYNLHTDWQREEEGQVSGFTIGPSRRSMRPCQNS